MCLIAFEWQPSHSRQLTLVANRDEFYDRPSRSAHTWDESPDIFAGKDLEQGGTWLGVSRRFRFAAVTNFRRPENINYPKSRGHIPTAFLNSTLDGESWIQGAEAELEQYAGFNALLFDGEELYYLSNRSQGVFRKLQAGTYGLSNHLLDTPWPKVKAAKELINQWTATEDTEMRHQKLLSGFRDTTHANDYELPDTGVGLELERMLSPLFIENQSKLKNKGYGTRTSTAISIFNNGNVVMTERNFNPGNGKAFDEQHHTIQCNP